MGTYEEFFEIITWAQLGIHNKPCGLLNVAGFYDPLIAFLDNAVAKQFVKPQHRAMILVEDDQRRMLERLRDYTSPITDQWVRSENR